jgi:putative restriction endonuclease
MSIKTNKMERKLWTREELILALNLYLKLPFGKLDSRTPEIILLAEKLGRTPGSISMRLNNFASVDPFHQQRGVRGLIGGIKQVQPIWDEFINNKEELLFESEIILARLEKKSIETKFSDILKGVEDLKGETKLREVKTRVNQNTFRQIVLANYSGKCAITGIDIPDLLIASHIVPWAKNEQERLNPENGICLSPLYDKAFDKGFMGIDRHYKVIFSPELKKRTVNDYYQTYFRIIEGKDIHLPQKYLPKKEFLEWHLEEIFRE